MVRKYLPHDRALVVPERINYEQNSSTNSFFTKINRRSESLFYSIVRQFFSPKITLGILEDT